MGEHAIVIRVGPEIEGVAGGHEELIGALDVAPEQQHVAHAVRHLVDRIADLREKHDTAGDLELAFGEELRPLFGGDHRALIGKIHPAQRTARIPAAFTAVRVREAGRVKTADLKRGVSAVGVGHGTAETAGRTPSRVEGTFHDVAIAIRIDGPGNQPAEFRPEILVLPEPGAVQADMASRHLDAGCETQVVCPVACGPVAAGDLQPAKALAGNDVGDTGHGLRAVGCGSPVAQYLDALDQQHRQRVDIEEALTHVVGNRREPGPAPVDQRKGGRQPNAAQAELRNALQVILLRGEIGARVGGKTSENVHRLGGAHRLEQLGIQRLHWRAPFVHDAPFDQGTDHHDFLDHRLADLGTVLVLRKRQERRQKRRRQTTQLPDFPPQPCRS